MPAITRRNFLTTTGGAGLAGILATGVPPARGQQREISYLCWNNFAPAWTRSWPRSASASPRTPGSRSRSTTSRPSSRPRSTPRSADPGRPRHGRDAHALSLALRAAAGGRRGPRGRAGEEARQGLPSAEETAKVNGVWRAVPQYHTFFVCAYREDLFKKGNLKVPDTWEDLYTVGKELKKMGHPVGIPISQNYDTISTAGPVLWSSADGSRQGRQDRPDQLAHRADARVVSQDVPGLHGAGGPVLDRREQQRHPQCGEGGLDPQPGQRLHRGPQSQDGHGRRHQPPSHAGRPQGRHETDVPRTSHLEVLQERRAVQGVDPLFARQAEVYDEYIMSGDAFNLGVYASQQDHPVLKTDPKFAALKRRACSSTATAGRRRPATRSSASPTSSSCPT